MRNEQTRSNKDEVPLGWRRSARFEAKKVTIATAEEASTSTRCDPSNDTLQQLAELQDKWQKLKGRVADKEEQMDELRHQVAGLVAETRRLRTLLAEQRKLFDEQKSLLAERIMSSRTAGPRLPEDAAEDNLADEERRLRTKCAKCLVIRRLEEKVDESREDLRKKVLGLGPFTFLKDKVVSVERQGWRSQNAVAEGEFWAQPRVVLVAFVDVRSKMRVKHMGWLFGRYESSSHLSFDHAITAEQRRLRAVQWPQLHEAKAKGLRWSWSDVAPHKLIVSGEGVHGHMWLMPKDTIWPF